MFAVKGLSVSIDKLRLFNDVSFSLDQDEVIVIKGNNGCGKTMLLRTIMGLHRPEEGTICLNEIDITKRSVYFRTQLGVAFLPENGRLFPELTVAENLFLAKWSAGESFKDRLDSIYSEIDFLHDSRYSYVKNLSGGQRQAVAIARLLLLNKELVLMDDPFTGLSTNWRDKFLNLFEKLFSSHKLGKSMIIVDQFNLFKSLFKCKLFNLDNEELRKGTVK